MPDETARLAAEADATLLGAVGLPEFDNAPPEQRPEKGLLGIRKVLGVYANLRPVRTYAALLDSSPLKNDCVDGTDMIIVRELTGGIYYGTPRGIFGRRRGDAGGQYHDLHAREIERIGRMAFHLARGRRKKVTSVDKSNVLENSQLWRRVVVEVAGGLSGCRTGHSAGGQLRHAAGAESAALRRRVTENMFGDILSDEGAVLAGSIGMLPSASLGEQAAVGRVHRPVRTGARLGAGHRRAEQSQPAGRDRLRGGHAGIQFRIEGRSRRGEPRHRAVLGQRTRDGGSEA